MSNVPASVVCPGCATEFAADLLACPACRQLVYTAQLTELSGQARAAESAGDGSLAMHLWRQALDLLPADSRQFQLIAAKLESLGNAAPAQQTAPPSPKSPPTSALGRIAALAASAGLLLWKLKFVAVFIATKAKFLLLGLAKGGTFLTMFLSFGVYWAAWGWPFALGLVLSIYIHEMGHVSALRRYGFKATAPMFIPGLGAYIRLHQRPVNATEDARIGLAGPLWGLAAAVAAYAVWLTTHQPIWGAIAHLGAWINLFNLIPLWQLDGARGFRALSRHQAWLLVLLAGSLWFYTAEGMLMLIILVAVVQAVAKARDATGDKWALFTYSVLLVALTLLSGLKVVLPA